MITKEDIKNLADLARIEVTESDAESLTGEIDAILGYVSKINEISVDGTGEIPVIRNIMREDVVTHKSGEYTEAILNNAPSREGSYLKVKKILE